MQYSLTVPSGERIAMTTQPRAPKERGYSLLTGVTVFSCLILLPARLQSQTTAVNVDIDKHALAAKAEDEASLDKLAKYLVRPCKTDREKARGIYRWITDRIAYDAEAFFSGDIGDNRAAAVLKNRKAVCEGYTALYLDLSKRMRLEAARVVGQARGIGYVAGLPIGKRENHAWVTVRLGGRWQLIDATWGAGHLADKKFVKRFSEYYFLPPPDQMLFTHLPAEPRWQLVKTPVSATEFARRPNVPRQLFELGVSSEAIQSAAAEKGFREIVRVYMHPSTATSIVKAPLTKYLAAGTEYEFTLKSEDYVEMAVFHDMKLVPMKRDGTLFTLKVTPNAGKLQVSGKTSESGPSFSGVLGYEVE
jgi:Transglutaminase-like superfamily